MNVSKSIMAWSGETDRIDLALRPFDKLRNRRLTNRRLRDRGIMTDF